MIAQITSQPIGGMITFNKSNCFRNRFEVRIPDQRDRCFRANVTEDSGRT